MPVDHEYFRNTNMIQWLWYNYQDLQDQEEYIVDSRDMIEYNASFVAPEIVSKIIEGRSGKASKDNIVAGTNDDVEFNEMVKKMFGRDPGLATSKESEVHNMDGVVDRITEYHNQQKAIRQTSSQYNYKYWANIDLE